MIRKDRATARSFFFFAALLGTVEGRFTLPVCGGMDGALRGSGKRKSGFVRKCVYLLGIVAKSH